MTSVIINKADISVNVVVYLCDLTTSYNALKEFGLYYYWLASLHIQKCGTFLLTFLARRKSILGKADLYTSMYIAAIKCSFGLKYFYQPHRNFVQLCKTIDPYR